MVTTASLLIVVLTLLLSLYAIIVLKYFPSARNTGIWAALVVELIGLLYLLVASVGFLRIVFAVMKIGPVYQLEVAESKSRVEGAFVNVLAKYGEDVIRFALIELKLEKANLESWPSYVSANFRTIAVFLTALGILASGGSITLLGKVRPGFYSPWELLLLAVVAVFFGLYLTSQTYNQIQTFARIIALLEFSLNEQDDPQKVR